ncbi:RNA polymerase sigma factor [Undibacterium sp. SXout20W]|uniref:RNA polymerase sigma factor n=1 Tax=Undibacterium sp. SXout20W TaxID=3413051 RepID=UPI003BF431AF
MKDEAHLKDWFKYEVLPFEPSLMRMLRKHWGTDDELSDIRQDVYIKIYLYVMQHGTPDVTKALLFTIARNTLIDRFRRTQIVSIVSVSNLEDLDYGSNDLDPERITSAIEELKILQIALDDLPTRCRQVVTLRKLEGLSLREIAQEMKIADGTVEKHLTLGLRALANSLFSQGVDILLSQKVRNKRKEETES